MEEKKDIEQVQNNAGDKGEETGEKREQWGGQIEFLLSCIGYCVGLGNVWRFPYLAYENGGGAFLIPYIIMLCLCGIPLFMMELSFGQFAGLGPITAWRSVPIFKGIGFGMVTVSFLVCIYYNVIIAWSLFYLFASFQSVLPWTLCDQWWNKESYCPPQNISLNASMETTTQSPTTTAGMTTSIMNATQVNKTRLVSTTEEYWKYRVLRIDQSSGIGDPGIVLWDLVLCLLLAWIIVFACLFKGVKSTGKVVYFTATFPYIILIILLVRGCTLEGALDGIIFYVKPDWERLKDSTVWTAAATQIFYSLGVSFGGLLTFASYNKFNNNIYRDTLIVSLGNCATSVFAGFVIFSVIGHMAFKVGQNVEDVIDQGPGLAFIAYPQAVALLPVPQLWSILFFFMLLTLGLDSQFAMLETVVTGFIDEFPTLLRKRKMHFTLFIAVVAFLLGILLVTEGGMYWFNLYNFYSAYYGLLALSLVMCLAINWGYGFFFTYRWRFNTDIKLMLGFEPNWYFKGAWMFVTPAALIFLIIYDAINSSPITYSDYKYPKWANDLGICMSVSCVAVIPIYAAWRVILALMRGEDLKQLVLPSKRWKPSDDTIKYDHMKGAIDTNINVFNITKRESDAPPYEVATYSQPVNDEISNPYPETYHSKL
uniref:sodium-dependent proline transporter-like n=1 Tax=Ciona intestinalis TaxID=7719 RepID=UPI000180C81F|nr:sodium-dependent proline transporter-like [Ciona intestinalis]|eukprot:XP_026691008.1 sodium-dependent proline transporter-like [Ciona intestinalis]